MGLKFYFTILLFVIITNNLSAKTEEFSIWIDNFKIRAEKSGISKTTIDETLNRVKVIPRIIELDRNQPEFTLTLSQYLRNVVSKKRIKKGISKIRENWELLETISNNNKSVLIMPVRFNITCFTSFFIFQGPTNNLFGQ